MGLALDRLAVAALVAAAVGQLDLRDLALVVQLVRRHLCRFGEVYLHPDGGHFFDRYSYIQGEDERRVRRLQQMVRQRLHHKNSSAADGGGGCGGGGGGGGSGGADSSAAAAQVQRVFRSRRRERAASRDSAVYPMHAAPAGIDSRRRAALAIERFYLQRRPVIDGSAGGAAASAAGVGSAACAAGSGASVTATGLGGGPLASRQASHGSEASLAASATSPQV